MRRYHRHRRSTTGHLFKPESQDIAVPLSSGADCERKRDDFFRESSSSTLPIGLSRMTHIHDTAVEDVPEYANVRRFVRADVSISS